MKRLAFVALFLGLGWGTSVLVAQETSCTTCHQVPDMFVGAAATIPEDFAGSVHAAVGLSCHDCHGGNPDIALADDIEAMDESLETSPFVGAPEPADIPGFCGRCHSDPDYMRRYRPDARSDQERIYATSHHGRALAEGDTQVATCTSCHRSHDIRRAGDPESSVHPTQVGETCSGCHSDAERMKAYQTADGRPLPTDQYGLWRHSVHARAMFEREDLSAPTCNDCHGNHGAAPPGLESVAFVCGQCHGREAGLFRASSKHDGFVEHNEYLADAGEDGCAACHESPEPQAELTDIRQLIECAVCHGNHGVMRPTVALLSPLPETPCAFCHEPFGPAAATALEFDHTAENYSATRDELLLEAEALGLEGDARFNWLVDRTESLPFHTLEPIDDTEPVRPRPEFARLFDKFRIGRTFETFSDPVTGDAISIRQVRCSNCHGAEAPAADEAVGFETAELMLDRMRELTGLTASAERVILAAHRGGIEVREGLEQLDLAVNAQIRLEALVHGFEVSDDGPFIEAFDEGMEHAAAAVETGRRALDELAFRRRGLGVVLAIIVVLLVALGIKIHRLGLAE